MPTNQDSDWFENDEFWDVSFAQMFPAWRMEGAPQEAQAIVELTGVRQGRLLDLCCGPGRHSLAFADLGFTVVGVDRTRALLDAARAAAHGREDMEFVEADMRDFDVGNEFDLAVNLFTSFGYLADAESNLNVLRRLHACLKPGGRLVLEVRGKEVFAKGFEGSRVTALEDGYLVQIREIRSNWSKLSTRWLYLKNGRYREYDLTHFLYSGQELRRMLLDAGFGTVRLYGDFNGADYGPEARALVAVAERPEA